MSTPLLVDDSHPAVHYTPSARAWELSTGLASAVNKTLHGANTTGSGVYLSFKGTGIQVYTMRGRAVPVTSFAIDGVHLATVTTPTSGSVTDFNYMTFSKRDLPSSSHVLAISHLNGTFWLDYFLVDGSLLDVDDGLSQSLAVTATVVSTVIVPSSSASPTTAIPGPSARQSTTHTLSIVTGTVSGVVFVILVVLCACLILRRRQRRDRRASYYQHVQPLLPSFRSVQRETKSSSFEKVSMTTDASSIAECTAATSANSDILASPRTVKRAAPGTRSTPLKLPGLTTGDNSFTGISMMGIRDRSPLENLRAGAAMGSPATPLALPHEVEHALSSASPEVQSGVMHILRSLFSRGASQTFEYVPRQTEVDSGVRIMEDSYVPPPEYTME